MSLTFQRKTVVILPRLIRLRDAPHYLGMDKNRFNQEVRPYLRSAPIGIQGVAFDRLDLDQWASDYMSRNERPTRQPLGGVKWDKKERQGSVNAAESGILKSRPLVSEFAKALAQAASKKQS